MPSFAGPVNCVPCRSKTVSALATDGDVQAAVPIQEGEGRAKKGKLKLLACIQTSVTVVIVVQS